MFKDNDFDGFDNSQLEEFLDKMKSNAHQKLDQNLEKGLGVFMFYIRVVKHLMEEFTPAIRKLTWKQYPLIKTETRPLVLKSIDALIRSTGHNCLFQLYGLLEDQKNGVNLREKYGDFEGWIESYARPGIPYLIDVSTYDDFPQMTEDQKKELVDEINTSTLEGFNLFESRKFEFIDVFQKLIFKYYKEIKELDSDGWIIYSVHINQEYDDYRMMCDHYKNFISHNFKEEDINLSYADYMDKLIKFGDEEFENNKDEVKEV